MDRIVATVVQCRPSTRCFASAAAPVHDRARLLGRGHVRSRAVYFVTWVVPTHGYESQRRIINKNASTLLPDQLLSSVFATPALPPRVLSRVMRRAPTSHTGLSPSPRATGLSQNAPRKGARPAARPVGCTSMPTRTCLHATNRTHGDGCPCCLSPRPPLPSPVTFPLACRPPPAPRIVPPGPRQPPPPMIPQRWTPCRRHTAAPAAG